MAELKTGPSVHCYDDHRVAMAFSVLGTVVEGTVLEEKRCVAKTWPNWWDDLENKVDIFHNFYHLLKLTITSLDWTERRRRRNPSQQPGFSGPGS